MTHVEVACSAPAYRTTPGFYDELFDSDGRPRPHAAELAAGLEALGHEQLAAAGRRRDAIFVQQGIQRHDVPHVRPQGDAARAQPDGRAGTR